MTFHLLTVDILSSTDEYIVSVTWLVSYFWSANLMPAVPLLLTAPRPFQPDSLKLGRCVLSLRAWSEHKSEHCSVRAWGCSLPLTHLLWV